ncbi:serine protease inhibitor 42Dd-like [Drosophila navojoa]|uniref:serine protease inhibitor 42Dd-like n=1 Tax=Drosophila navojoa TaxID=7232 RepID=UPI0011BF5548|nr:serine protease inhibitor 42Dd-like [Drosophila navojoa]
MSDVAPISSAIFASRELLPALGNTTQAVNFSDPQGALKTINDWVAEHTNGRLKSLIDRVDANMKMILLSTSFFDVEWKYKFDPKFTKKANFYTSLTQSVPVDMMNVRGKFFRRYIENIDADVLELPFALNNVQMLILLPRKTDGIDKLVDGLTTLELSDLKFKGSPRKVIDVKLPKFKINSKADLRKSLQSLGVHDLFTNASFPGVANHGVMKVDVLVQNVALEVSERGALFPIVTLPKRKPHKFVADHPFVFLIRLDNDFLYGGRVNFVDN